MINEEQGIKPYVIGLDLGGTNSVFGIVDARGDIKATTAIKTGGFNSAEDYVKASVEALQPIIEQVGGIGKIKAMGTPDALKKEFNQPDMNHVFTYLARQASRSSD